MTAPVIQCRPAAARARISLVDGSRWGWTEGKGCGLGGMTHQGGRSLKLGSGIPIVITNVRGGDTEWEGLEEPMGESQTITMDKQEVETKTMLMLRPMPTASKH